MFFCREQDQWKKHGPEFESDLKKDNQPPRPTNKQHHKVMKTSSSGNRKSDTSNDSGFYPSPSMGKQPLHNQHKPANDFPPVPGFPDQVSFEYFDCFTLTVVT